MTNKPSRRRVGARALLLDEIVELAEDVEVLQPYSLTGEGTPLLPMLPPSCLDLATGQLNCPLVHAPRPLRVPGDHTLCVLPIPALVCFHEALMIGHRFFVCLLEPVPHTPHGTPDNPLHAEPAIGFKQRIVLRKADHVFVESPVCLDIALEVHETMIHDQRERRLHAPAQFC